MRINRRRALGILAAALAVPSAALTYFFRQRPKRKLDCHDVAIEYARALLGFENGRPTTPQDCCSPAPPAGLSEEQAITIGCVIGATNRICDSSNPSEAEITKRFFREYVVPRARKAKLEKFIYEIKDLATNAYADKIKKYGFTLEPWHY